MNLRCVLSAILSIFGLSGFGRTNDSVEPRSRLNVTSLRIQSNILNRFVRTRVLRNLKNPSEDFVEETILTLLPEEALVSDLTLEIDGKKYVCKSEEKETAWEIYIGGKNRGELPATVTMGESVDGFTFSALRVDVPPGANISVAITYDHLLERRISKYYHGVYFLPDQIYPDLFVSAEMVDVCPVTRTRIDFSKRPFTEYEVVDNAITVSWQPSAKQQSRLNREGLFGFFRFTFQLDTGGHDDIVLISGGYFAQFFNPPSNLTPMSKHVILVLSFFNHLLEAWDAVSAILERLEHSDFLTIVYHERGEPKLWGTNRCTESSMEHSLSAIVPASHDNKVRAKAFLRTGIDLYEGSTIPGLLTALDLAEISIDNHSNKLRLNLFPVIVHLAEKHDHTSVDNHQKEHDDALITSVSRKSLRHRVPIYNLVLGSSRPCFRFFKRMSRWNYGFARRIVPDSGVADQVGLFFREIASPLLTNISFLYGKDSVEEMTETKFPFVYDGSQLVAAGKIKNINNFNTFKPWVLSVSSGRVFNSTEVEVYEGGEGSFVYHQEETSDFLRRMWVYLTLKQVLRQDERSGLEGTQNRTEESRQLALKLALANNYVTPLTSLVVYQNDRKYQVLDGGLETFRESDEQKSVESTENRADSELKGALEEFLSPQEGASPQENGSRSSSSLCTATPLTTVDKLRWLGEYWSGNKVTLPTGKEGANETYLLRLKEKIVHSFQACISPLGRTASCKHLFSCPLLAVSNNLMDYLSHFCSFTLRGLTYAGVCCPENLATLTS